ncbi:MAG TPA: quinol:electron acceptor oxidoreductase subunit ActD, partial [Phycisphaerae bacterium]
PITFELTVLFAALAGAIGMLMLNGLPRLDHPAFEIPHFERASTDRFFLCVEADDPQFDAGALRLLLTGHDPLAVTEVMA